LSASTIGRLEAVWQDEHARWSRRDLSNRRYVYLWVDGIHFGVRLEDAAQCILVVIGATAEGKKELVTLADGYRESEASWREVLLDLKAPGLKLDPHLAPGDGALGFWKALPQVFGTTQGQRCWVHKTANVLNKLPTRQDAERAFDHFLTVHRPKYPKAAECLEKDRKSLLAFYDFPAEHWIHLRTTNPIESTFATGPAAHRQNPRLRVSGKHFGDGIHVGKKCRATLAETVWNSPPSSSHRGIYFQRRPMGRPRKNRRLT